MKCNIASCCAQAAVYLVEVRHNSYLREGQLCEEHARQSDFLQEWDQILPNAVSKWNQGDRVRFELKFLAIFEKQQYASRLFLAEVQGARRIVVESGYFEAVTIRRAVVKQPMPRPWTFAAIEMIINALGAKLEEVLVDEYDDQHNFHAKIRMRQADRVVSVDLRPSDALTLAVVTDVPIFITEAVLAKSRQKETS